MHTETTFTDTNWATVPTGVYRYVIRAVYANNVLARPAFSNRVGVGATSEVGIFISTENKTTPTGAVVSLINRNRDPEFIYHQVATSGTVVFPDVWHGDYILRVALSGFTTVIDEFFNVVSNETIKNVEMIKSTLVLLDEGFEGPIFPPPGWTSIDEDGDGHVWFQGAPAAMETTQSGMFTATSHSFLTVAPLPDGGRTPDNLLISPAVTIPANVKSATLSWWVAVWHDRDAAENYSVQISTNTAGPPDPEHFEFLFGETMTPAGFRNWEQRTISLMEYAGQTIYIAWRHHFTESQFYLTIDDILLVVEQDVVSDDDREEIPVANRLRSNFPNPFNPSTMISFDMAQDGHVTIDIFNIRGQRIKSLVNEHLRSGVHTVEWNGTDDQGRQVSSGIYLYQMQSENYTSTRRMLLMK
jgi:hypothetical protein